MNSVKEQTPSDMHPSDSDAASSETPSSSHSELLANGIKKRKTDQSDKLRAMLQQAVEQGGVDDFGTAVMNVLGRKGDEWEQTMHKVIECVVSVHFASVTPFDTEGAYASEASGFVVDAENGIIMTNRHVVGPGVFYGYAVFNDHQETPVKPIYRDPVHDFGFLKFDPAARRAHGSVSFLNLRPELAQIGREIRIIGNDAGEKLSILSGFISRLDRNAPEYGGMTYNDFNTEYIQAAASASGGSSGSPVVDIEGNVVALQAGGSSHASTDFFLPLHSGKRALDLIREGKPVSRGTVQVQWLIKPYDECRRLGLSEDQELNARTLFPKSTGMLVAETVLPEGPADFKLEEGDVLISINDEPVIGFKRVEEVLDASVGEEITFLVQRNGTLVRETVAVMDLHSITPKEFVSASGAIFHNLSYQIARLYAIPVKGVYVADTGTMFHTEQERTGWLIDEFNNVKVADVKDLIQVLSEIPDLKRVVIKFRLVTDLHSPKTAIVQIDRHWHKSLVVHTRNDTTGVWDSHKEAILAPPEPLQRLPARFQDIYIDGKTSDRSNLVKSFVKVEALIPFSLDGLSGTAHREFGFVFDHVKGYVVVSRFCVPHFLCDVSVIVANSVIVPAKVRFLHPQLGFAIVQYDPSLVDAPIQSLQFSDEKLVPGKSVVYLGYKQNTLVFTTETRVIDVETFSIPANPENAPRFRATNLVSPTLDSAIITNYNSGSGVITDERAQGVLGLWMSFHGETTPHGVAQYFMPVDASAIRPVIEQLRASDEIPDPRFLDFEVASNTVLYARLNGVSEEWITRVQNTPGSRSQFYTARRVSSTLTKYIAVGDMVLAIGGEVVTSAYQLMNLASETVQVTVVRDGHEQVVEVPTLKSSSVTTTDVVSWSGATVHSPHHAVLQQVRSPPSLVYVADVAAGSPANLYGLYATQFITHINGRSTPTVSEFYEAVQAVPDETYVKLRVVTFEGIPSALSVRTNYHYFKTGRRTFNGDSWDLQGAREE